MSCDHCNDLTNVGGAMGLALTRPLASFFVDPRYPILPHWQKPPGETPPPVLVPVGPQARPAWIVYGGGPAETYAPPDFNAGGVPGGLALRLNW